jgi:hypothetical protein
VTEQWMRRDFAALRRQPRRVRACAARARCAAGSSRFDVVHHEPVPSVGGFEEHAHPRDGHTPASGSF